MVAFMQNIESRLEDYFFAAYVNGIYPKAVHAMALLSRSTTGLPLIDYFTRAIEKSHDWAKGGAVKEVKDVDEGLSLIKKVEFYQPQNLAEGYSSKAVSRHLFFDDSFSFESYFQESLIEEWMIIGRALNTIGDNLLMLNKQGLTVPQSLIGYAKKYAEILIGQDVQALFAKVENVRKKMNGQEKDYLAQYSLKYHKDMTFEDRVFLGLESNMKGKLEQVKEKFKLNDEEFNLCFQDLMEIDFFDYDYAIIKSINNLYTAGFDIKCCPRDEIIFEMKKYGSTYYSPLVFILAGLTKEDYEVYRKTKQNNPVNQNVFKEMVVCIEEYRTIAKKLTKDSEGVNFPTFWAGLNTYIGRQFTLDSIVDNITNWWNRIKEYVAMLQQNSLTKSIKQAVEGQIESLKEIFAELQKRALIFKDNIQAFWQHVKKEFQEQMIKIKQLSGQIIIAMNTWWKEHVNHLQHWAKSWTKNVFEQVRDYIEKTTIWDTVRKMFQKIKEMDWKKVWENFQHIIERAVIFVKTGMDGIGSWLKQIVNGAQQEIDLIYQMIRSMYDQAEEVLKSSINWIGTTAENLYGSIKMGAEEIFNSLKIPESMKYLGEYLNSQIITDIISQIIFAKVTQRQIKKAIELKEKKASPAEIEQFFAKYPSFLSHAKDENIVYISWLVEEFKKEVHLNSSNQDCINLSLDDWDNSNSLEANNSEWVEDNKTFTPPLLLIERFVNLASMSAQQIENIWTIPTFHAARSIFQVDAVKKKWVHE